MGMSKYAELYNRVMSYLDDRDWESAHYSRKKRRPR